MKAEALKDEYTTLRNLYWRLRLSRPCSTPCTRTWHRRIRAEKMRLLALGADPIEIHRVCRSLTRSNARTYA